ncbi:MAG: FkbM family methyltransferase [Pseudomonadota bacterium]
MTDAALSSAFLAFAAENVAQSHAQLCQDLFVLWALPDQTGGVFFEAGAFDGLSLSNTALLEAAGWDGVLVEPMAGGYAAVCENRRARAIHAALAEGPARAVDLRVCEKGELSRLDAVNPNDGHERKGNRAAHTIESVGTISIADALDGFDRLDYLSLDTEGNELECLSTVPFESHRPTVLTVEHNNTPREAEIDAFLADRGFERVLADVSKFDGWYLDRDALEALRREGGRRGPLPAVARYETPPVASARNGQIAVAVAAAKAGHREAAEAFGAAFQVLPQVSDLARNGLNIALAKTRGDRKMLGALYAERGRLRPSDTKSLARGAGYLLRRGKVGAMATLLAGVAAPKRPAPAPAPRPSDDPPTREGVMERATSWLAAGETAAADALMRRAGPLHSGEAAFDALLCRAILAAREANPREMPVGSTDKKIRGDIALAGARAIPATPRDPRAGAIVPGPDGPFQVMHEGTLVPKDAYYGAWMTDLIARSGGRHEPQEEFVFEAVLSAIEPGATMIELGAFWAFYTASFLRRQQGKGAAVIVEPAVDNLAAGLATLRRNGLSAEVRHGIVGDTEMVHETGFGAKIAPERVDVAAIMAARGWETLTILHADIQGAETALLTDIAPLLEARRIRYLFISTHGHGRQVACLKALQKAGYALIAEHDGPESFSVDGLIVARAPDTDGPQFINIARRGVTP